MTADPEPVQGTPQEAAEALAALGLNVIPIRPGRKHPQLDDWRNVATDDLDTIRAWWEGLYRGHGVGIVTGPGSGVWVLDVDIADGKPGRTNLDTLVKEHGPLPKTVITVTGTGGLHLYFKWDPNRPINNGHAGNLPPGLDIRGEGGQVVAPPTVHPNGTPYAWHTGLDPWTVEIAEAPEWLYELLLTEPEPSTIPPPTLKAGTGTSSNVEGDSIAAWIAETHDWHTELNNAGWVVHSTKPDETWWTRPGKSTREGHSAVLHEPDGPLVVFSTEAPPELVRNGTPTKDRSGLSLSLFGYIAATQHGGDRSEAARAARAERTALERLPSGWAEGNEQPGDNEAGGERVNRHTAALLTEDALAARKPPAPLAHGWLYRQSLAVIYGPPKKGKTFVAIDLAMAVATGHNWLGGRVEAGNVLYCLGEGVAGMHRRLTAWREHRNIATPAQLKILPHTPQLGNPLDVGEFIEAVNGEPVDLIIIDTLARASVGVEENSSKEMGEVIAQADRIRDVTGACVLLVHHTGKDSTRGTRGSSALTGAIDTGIEVRGDPKAMTLANTEQKDAEPADERTFRAESVGESMVFVATQDLAAASGAVLNIMEALVEIDTGGVPSGTWKRLCEERGIPERSFYRGVKWLQENGQIENVGTTARALWTTLSGYGEDYS